MTEQASATSSAVKRVMSKHCHENMREEKKSKMGLTEEDSMLFGADAIDEAAGEIMKNLVLDVDDDADETPAPDVPIATISHNQSRASTTHSSLSDEGVNDEGDEKPLDESMGDATAAAVAAARKLEGRKVDTKKSPINATSLKAAGGMTRQISNDDSFHSGSREDSNTSDGGTGRGTSVGNWGWFEDVHPHESGFLPDAVSPSPGGEKQKKKKGGLLHVGSELMQNVLQAIVEPHRQEANTMAVTAPTYVLEESLSSQKLWKQTAGNRPPQPVEERAFFEQVWAQNFTRSKVKYEIPVEVLTASTPISISPFNDDGFGEDGAHHGNLSNYNLAAPFNMKSDDEHAAIAEAGADVAEEALNQHLNSNGAVEMYFDPNRPKDYNLKTLGPHHHHHTLVNKKVQGAGEENELTVLVRGDNVFGTTVSKSFPRETAGGEPVAGIDTVSVSIASYRVVESKKHGKYAQYLVIFCDGNFRNTVGVWKRYSDFSELSRKVTHGHSESCAAVVTGLNPLSVSDDHDVEILPNAITSWRLLKKRQRWYRCLDAGYLSLKVFLLERFLHDILFESSNPQILRDFVDINSSAASKLNTKG